MAILHPGWEPYTRLPARMTICPRCGAAFPANAASWRWTGHQWLCRRFTCVRMGEPYQGVMHVSEAWVEEPRVVVVEPEIEETPKARLDRVLTEIEES